MIDQHDLRTGLRVVTCDGDEGTVLHVHTGVLAGAVVVLRDAGVETTERAHTLRPSKPAPATHEITGEQVRRLYALLSRARMVCDVSVLRPTKRAEQAGGDANDALAEAAEILRRITGEVA